MPASAPPIPQRIPPLAWRQPALLWTPAALALALGWPALALRDSNALMLAALIGGAVVVAASLTSLGGAWLIGKAPRTRRDVIVHFLAVGAMVSLGAPFVLAGLLDAAAAARESATGLREAIPYALTPLALLLGLPIAFFHGLAFSFVALDKRVTGPPRVRDKRTPAERKHEAQPFV